LIKIIKKIIFNIIIFLILSTFMKNIYSGEVILQKNNIIITNEDLLNYKNLYKDFFGSAIENNTAIKNLYLVFSIIDLQISRNPEFINNTNNLIKNDIKKYKNYYGEYVLSYFLRYEILKKDYMTMYMSKNNFKEFDNKIKNQIDFYDSSKCDSKKISIEYKNLDNKQKSIIMSQLTTKEIFIKNNEYICLRVDNIEEIQFEINNFLSSRNAHEGFLKYVYKNIK